ncbi:MAG TPA: phosphatase, partial [Bacteroidia bacterium]|nr:phosphatase [Bacteroidia bacterium]
MGKRIAVIDLGTNTFNLLVAEITGPHSFISVYNEKLPVKLGEGGINRGFIAEKAFHRGVQAMENYAATVRDWKADEVMAFATSAVRSASNGKEFVQTVKEKTGISITIISGEEEAELICTGVRHAVKLSEEPSLIIDIGGGSTEFIIASRDKVFWKQSFEIGASRLLQKFEPSDPITEKETAIVSAYLVDVLAPLWAAVQQYNVHELVGASGSFESLAEMVTLQFHKIPFDEKETEFEFDLDECAVVHRQIMTSTRAQRLKMEGLISMRVDLIVVSALLVELIIRRLGITRMRLSTYALKEGV